MSNIYLYLLGSIRLDRHVESFGYLDLNEAAEASGIRVNFQQNCNELAHQAVKLGKPLSETILTINLDLDLIYQDATHQNLDGLDIADFEHLKSTLADAVRKEWERSPLQRFTNGHLNRRPWLVVIPIMAIFLGAMLLVTKLGFLN